MRVLGAIGVVELHQPVDMNVIQPMLVEQGVWLRPFGQLLYTMPPYIIKPAQLQTITDAIEHVVGFLSDILMLREGAVRTPDSWKI